MTAFEENRVADPVVRLRLFGAIEASSFSGEGLRPRGRKAQAILAYLALSGEDAVPRQRLVDLLWSGRWTDQGRASLRQSLLELRNVFGAARLDVIVIERETVSLDRSRVWIDGLSRRSDDRPVQPPTGPLPPVERLLETLVGLDPRFDAWIVALRESVAAARRATAGDPPAAPGAPANPSAPRDKVTRGTAREVPSHRLVLSVAPLIKIGPGDLETYVAPSLMLELINAIARFRWLGVRQSPEVGAADYRVEGYITAVGEGLRLSLRLIDEGEEGVIVWTGDCLLPLPLAEHALADLTGALVSQIDPEILAIETRKAFEKPVSLNGAYACVLQAMALLYRFEQPAWTEAQRHAARAQALDPFCARASAVSALCHITGIAQGWCDAPAVALGLADRDARRAIGIDPHDSLALALAGHIRAFVHHDFRSALSLFDRALRSNPSCGFAWGYSALTHAYLGQTDEARGRLIRATSILLHDPYLSFVEGFEAVICHFAGDFEAVIAIERGQLAQRPKFTNSRKNVIAALCHLGRWAEARDEQARLVADEPGFTWEEHLRVYPFGRAIHRHALRRVLQAAGLIAEDGASPADRPLGLRLA